MLWLSSSSSNFEKSTKLDKVILQSALVQSNFWGTVDQAPRLFSKFSNERVVTVENTNHVLPTFVLCPEKLLQTTALTYKLAQTVLTPRKVPGRSYFSERFSIEQTEQLLWDCPPR